MPISEFNGFELTQKVNKRVSQLPGAGPSANLAADSLSGCTQGTAWQVKVRVAPAPRFW